MKLWLPIQQVSKNNLYNFELDRINLEEVRAFLQKYVLQEFISFKLNFSEYDQSNLFKCCSIIVLESVLESIESLVLETIETYRFKLIVVV